MSERDMQATHAYIAKKPCGCVTAVTVDLPDHPDWTSHDVADFIKSGRSVERVTIAEARQTLLVRCKCEVTK